MRWGCLESFGGRMEWWGEKGGEGIGILRRRFLGSRGQVAGCVCMGECRLLGRPCGGRLGLRERWRGL